jgi:DNA primase
MNRIPQSTVDRIYTETDILSVISDYVQLKKRGNNHFGLSPFTNEKTPSFAVSPSKQIWKDFSTGKGGNAVSFLMESEGMTYRESLIHLAEKAGIPIEYDDEQVAPDNIGSLKALSSHVSDLFHSRMVSGSPALEYLTARGLSIETIAAFHIGHAPQEWEWLGPKLTGEGYSREIVKLSGLCFENDTNGRLTDRFRNRIMFPIHNHFGQVIAFGGRVFSGEASAAKYINSPESEIYHKSKVLYGLHQARKAIQEKDLAILVEGYMDVAMLHQSNHCNAVASCGTALTVHQCQLLRRFSRNVLIVRDSDKAGLAAMVKDIKVLLGCGMYPSVLPLPKCEDPDSYCRAHGGEGFEAHRQKHTRNFVDALVGIIGKGRDTTQPQARTAVVNEVLQVLAVIQDPVLAHTSIERLSKLMQVPTQVLGKAMPVSSGKAPVANDRGSALSGMHPHELCALRAIVNDSQVSSEIVELLGEIPLESMSETFVSAFQAMGELDDLSLNAMLENPSLRPIASELLQVQPIEGNPSAILRDFQRHHLNRLISECKEKLKTATDKQPYLSKLQALNRMLRGM